MKWRNFVSNRTPFGTKCSKFLGAPAGAARRPSPPRPHEVPELLWLVPQEEVPPQQEVPPEVEEVEHVQFLRLVSVPVAIAMRTATVQQVLRVPRVKQDPLVCPATGAILDKLEAEEEIRKCEWASCQDACSVRLVQQDPQALRALMDWQGCKE